MGKRTLARAPDKTSRIFEKLIINLSGTFKKLIMNLLELSQEGNHSLLRSFFGKPVAISSTFGKLHEPVMNGSSFINLHRNLTQWWLTTNL